MVHTSTNKYINNFVLDLYTQFDTNWVWLCVEQIKKGFHLSLCFSANATHRCTHACTHAHTGTYEAREAFCWRSDPLWHVSFPQMSTIIAPAFTSTCTTATTQAQVVITVPLRWSGPSLVCSFISVLLCLSFLFLPPSPNLAEYVICGPCHSGTVACVSSSLSLCQDMSFFPLHFARVCHLIPFTLWVCHLIPFTLSGYVILTPSLWQCLSSYPLHSVGLSSYPLHSVGLSSYPLQVARVFHLIPFTLSGYIILSPSLWQGVSSYPLHSARVCHNPSLCQGVSLTPSLWQGKVISTKADCHLCHCHSTAAVQFKSLIVKRYDKRSMNIDIKKVKDTDMHMHIHTYAPTHTHEHIGRQTDR